MADIAVVAKKVRRHPETKIHDMDAGGAGNVGDYVYIAADGDAEQADASVVGTAYGFGIVISATGNKTTFVAGDRLAVAFAGKVSGFVGMTPGDILYASDTAGKLGDVAGTVAHKAARALSAETLLLVPQLTEA